MDIITILYLGAAIGILDTMYLLYHKVKGTDVACPFFPNAWCRKVQYSPQSKTLGIPNSLAGLGMYVAILGFTYAYMQGSGLWWPVPALVTFGFGFSLYFTYVQAFVLRAFCTWCVLSALNFAFMFWALWFR